MLHKGCVIGHFGYNKNLLNGQTVKTKIITSELEKKLGSNQVLKIDTGGGALSYLKLPFQIFGALRKCKNVIILPAKNGLRVIAPILVLENILFKRSLHYIVIGGWLSDFLKDRSLLAKFLKCFDCIYAETEELKRSLEKQGFTNISVMPNCKELAILDEPELIFNNETPLKLCTFSRVMKEKGIEDAVSAVQCINHKHGETVYTLDIYGQIDSEQIEWFNKLQNVFPDYIKYCGSVPYDLSTKTLKDYFALLFPTRYFTEGVPGTIIDAYAAGVPVIYSRWESASDVIKEGVTGLGYTFANIDELELLLDDIYKEPRKFNDMKKNCLKFAYKYIPKNVIALLVNNLK